MPPRAARLRLAVPGLLALLAAAAGCAPSPGDPGAAAPFARLPSDAVEGAGDPTRAAILGTAYAFSTPVSLAGRPDSAARAIAMVEYLATEIPTGARWVEYSPLVGMELLGARQELRSFLGIPPEAPPQAVVNALYAAARALQGGDRAAAERALGDPAGGAGGAPMLLRLAALPALPRTRTATALAQQELFRVDQDTRLGGAGANDGGKD